MLNFKYPYLLAIPIIFLILLISIKIKNNAIKFSNINYLKQVPTSLKAIIREPLLKLLFFSFIVALSIGAARPYSVTKLPSNVNARNIMLTIDSSGSMETGDYSIEGRPVNRLVAVKYVVSEFIENRVGDRIGLVAFGDQAFLACPLTLDSQIVKSLTKELTIGIAGRGTAIGDGLGLSIKRMEKVPGKSKAIILLTDGVNTSGSVDPIQAAKVAKEFAIKIHTIGVGSPQTASYPGNFSPEYKKSLEFDEVLLKEIAAITDGVYFNAESLEDLKKIYQSIDKLETSSSKEPSKQIIKEHFVKFALWALIIYAVYLLLANTILFKFP